MSKKQVVVKQYNNQREFERDANKMVADFYRIAEVTQVNKNAALRNLAKSPVGGNVLWDSSVKSGKITVTYVRDSQEDIIE